MVIYKGVALEKRTQFIIKEISLDLSAESILDIGCGTGSVATELGKSGYDVTAIDLDLKSIDECKQNNRLDNVEFLLQNAETMDLEKKFDVIIACEIIEHSQHPDLVVKSIRRHLNKDGIAIVSVPNGYSPWEIVVSRFLQKSKLVAKFYRSPRLFKKMTGASTPFYSNNAFCFHINFFSYGRFKKLLQNNGFKIMYVNHSDLGIFPEWKGFRVFKKVECKIADYVPHVLAGGWLMVIEK